MMFVQATVAYRHFLRTVGLMRLTVQINSRTENEEERTRLTFNVIAWKKKAQISRRMFEDGKAQEEGPLK